MVDDPDTGGIVLTGRTSASLHPWLADHAVSDTVVVPGAVLVEWAIQAGLAKRPEGDLRTMLRALVYEGAVKAAHPDRVSI